MTHAEDTHDNLDAWWQRKYDALEKERDELQAKINVATYVAGKVREIAGVGAGSILDVVTGLTKERDAAIASCAAMREALQHIANGTQATLDPTDTTNSQYQEDVKMCAIAALYEKEPA